MEREARAQRIGALPRPWRLVVLGFIGLAVAVPFAQAALALHDGWTPVGDVALIGMRARDVAFSPPTLGQPSTASATGATHPSAHLGPLESYLLAPSVGAFGPRFGLALGAAALNAFAWGATLFLAHRRGGVVLFALFALAMALFVRSIGPSVLHDPINSDIATLSLAALALAAWSMLERDLAVAPLLVFFSAFVLQAHLANIGVAFLLSVIGGVGVALALRRRRRRRGDLLWVLLAAQLLVLAWLPPILHELGHRPSNVGAVWRSIWEPREKLGVSYGIGRAAAAVAPWRLPYFAQEHRTGEPPGDIGQPRLLIGLLLLGLAGSLAVAFHFRGRRSVARYLGVCVAVALALMATTASLPPDSAIRPELGRPVWLLGVIVWVGLAWAGWWFLDDARRARVGPKVVAAILALTVLVSGAALSADPVKGNGGEWAMHRVQSFSGSLRAALPRGSYLVVPLGASAFLTMAPAVVIDLDTHGYRIYVDHTPFSEGYDVRHYHGHQPVDGTVLIMGRGEATVPSGARQLVAQQPIRQPGIDDEIVMEAYLLPEDAT